MFYEYCKNVGPCWDDWNPLSVLGIISCAFNISEELYNTMRLILWVGRNCMQNWLYVWVGILYFHNKECSNLRMTIKQHIKLTTPYMLCLPLLTTSTSLSWLSAALSEENLRGEPQAENWVRFCLATHITLSCENCSIPAWHLSPFH